MFCVGAYQEEEEEEENIPSLPAVAREHLGGRMKTVHWSADEESRHSKVVRHWNRLKIGHG